MSASNPTCCGERPPGVAGSPEVVACKLCLKSPNYWRNEGQVVSSPWTTEAPEPASTLEPESKPGPPSAPPGFPATAGGSLW